MLILIKNPLLLEMSVFILLDLSKFETFGAPSVLYRFAGLKKLSDFYQKQNSLSFDFLATVHLN